MTTTVAATRSSGSVVVLTKHGGVGEILLNRPERLNAIDCPLAQGLVDALEDCEGDRGVRVVVLRGAGRLFCAGGDIKEMAASVANGAPERFLRDVTALVHRVILAIRRLPQPVVAEVRGGAHGAGLSLALACDLVVAAEDATFSTAFVNIGASPDSGATFFLPRLLGRLRASTLLLLSETIDARGAQALGLVARVASVDELAGVTNGVALELARRSAPALARTKRLVDASLTQGLEAQLEDERVALTVGGRTTDFVEGVQAFLDKRPPEFRDPA